MKHKYISLLFKTIQQVPDDCFGIIYINVLVCPPLSISINELFRPMLVFMEIGSCTSAYLIGMYWYQTFQRYTGQRNPKA